MSHFVLRKVYGPSLNCPNSRSAHLVVSPTGQRSRFRTLAAVLLATGVILRKLARSRVDPAILGLCLLLATVHGLEQPVVAMGQEASAEQATSGTAAAAGSSAPAEQSAGQPEQPAAPAQAAQPPSAPVPAEVARLEEFGRPEVAERLKLSGRQQADIRRLLAEFRSKVEGADQATQIQVAKEFLPRILAILSAEQRRAYEEGRAVPRLRFQFRFQRWEHVLEWLAEQAGLSLVLDAPPPGTFNYTDTREYTPSEAIDLVNSVLLTKGYALIRRDQMLILVNLKSGIPEGLIPWVSIEEAQRMGAYDLVTVSFSVGRRDASQVAEAIRPLLGPYGRVLPIPATRQVVVTDRAGLMASIDRVIQALPEPSPPRQEPPPREPERQELRIYPLGKVDPTAVMNILRELFPSARIVHDTKLNQLNVLATPSQHSGIETILKRLESPEAPERMPRLEVYPLPRGASATDLVSSLQLVAPGAKIRADEEANRLVVWASPAELQLVEDALSKLGDQPDALSAPQVETYRLRRSDARMVAYILEKLVPKARVSYDYYGRNLVVYATAADQAIVRSIIEEIEPQAVQPGEVEVRVYTLQRVKPSSLVEMLQETLPVAKFAADDNSRRLTVVAPASVQAQVEKAVREADAPAEGESQARLRSYMLPQVSADSATVQVIINFLQQLFPQAKLTPDPRRGQLLVYATEEEHKRIEEMLAEWSASARPVEGSLEVYSVTPEEKARLQALLTNLASELPTLRVLPDATPGTIAIWARPHEHELVRQIVSQLRSTEGLLGSRVLRAYPLGVIELAAAQETLQKLFPQVQVVADQAGRRLLVWALPDEHEAIERTLRELDTPAPQENQPRFETYPIRGVNAASVLSTLQQLVPGARLVLDSGGRRIIAWATPAEHAKIVAALAELREGQTPETAPYLMVYPLGGLNPSQALTLLQSLVPDAQLSIDNQSGSLLAVAVANDHETIRTVLDRLGEARRQLGGTEIRYYPYQLPPSSGLLEVLGKLAPSAQITVDKENRRLIVVASPDDHRLIEQTLQDYEQKTPGVADRQLVIYQLSPAERKRLEALLPQLQSQLPDLQLLPETVPGEVAVWARPEEHRVLGEIIAQLRKPAELERPFVLIAHAVRSADPKSVVEMLQKLFPDAQVVLDARARRILIWAPASAEAQIRRVLEELDTGAPGQWQEQLRVYPVVKTDLQVALQVLRERLPEVRITPDLRANTLLVWGTEQDHQEVAELLEQLESGVDEKHRPRLEIYPAGGYDMTALSTLLRTLVPEARLAVDPKTGGLAVLGRPEEHDLVRKALEELARKDLGGTPEARTYTLPGGGSPWGVVNVLATVFPNVRVTLGTQPNQLLVWARPDEHEQVAKVLAELTKEEPPETAPRLEVYTLEGTNASEAGRILRFFAPEAVFTTGPDPQQLLVWARPADHQKIRQALTQWAEAVRKPETLPELAVFNLKYLSAASAIQALRGVVPEAQFSVGSSDRQLVVLARSGQLERVAAALEKLDLPSQTAGELRVYTLEGMSTMRAFYATRLLREAVPEATFALGADPSQLLVWATPEVHEKVRALVDTLFQRPPPEKAPRVEVYRLKTTTAASASQVLRAAVPEANLTVDSSDPYKLTVWAAPQEHELIARILEQIDVPNQEAEDYVARLYTIEGIPAYYAIQLLGRMFPGAQFVPTIDPQQLLAWAKPEEHEKIRQAIAELAPSGEEKPSLVTYDLQTLDARTATSLIQTVAPAAKVTTSTDGRKLLVYARAAEHARIAEVLQSADLPPEAPGLRMEVYPVRGVGNAYTVMMLLREVFPQAKFSIGANLQQLVVYASPADHAQISQAIERLAELTRSEQPEVVVYDIGTADATRLASMLETAFPGSRFIAGSEPGKLIAWAPRSDQELIAQAIEKLRAETWGPENRILSVYPLRRTDAQTLLQVLTPVLQGNAQFVVDNARNSLVVWADRRYHEAIRQAIEQYLSAAQSIGELEPRVYRFRYADPSAAVTVVRSLAPDAQVAYDWANQALVISATPEDHRKIELALLQLDRADMGGVRPILRVYSLEGLDSTQAYSNLRQLFRYDPTVQLSLDENSGSVFALAPESKHEQIAQILKEMELVARQGGGVVVQTYSLRNTDPQAALALVRNLAQQRGFRADASLDSRRNALVVIARAEHHRLIAEALEQIRGEERQLEILQLEELDPYSAQLAIRQLFADESYPPEVDIDYSAQQLIIQATAEQHRRIRELLGKMGETRLAVVSALGGGSPRVIPFEGNAVEALREIERVWSRIRPNPLRIIVAEPPREAQPPGVEGRQTVPSGTKSPQGPSGSTESPDKLTPPVAPSGDKTSRADPPGTFAPKSSPSIFVTAIARDDPHLRLLTKASPSPRDISWEISITPQVSGPGSDQGNNGTQEDKSTPGSAPPNPPESHHPQQSPGGPAETLPSEPQPATKAGDTSAQASAAPSASDTSGGQSSGPTGTPSGQEKIPPGHEGGGDLTTPAAGAPAPEDSSLSSAPAGQFSPHGQALSPQESGTAADAASVPGGQPPEPSAVPPVYVLVQEGSVTVVSEDPEAAAELESLLRTLSARAAPSSRSITVYELRHANASTVAEIIEDFLRRSSWGFRRTLSGLVIIPDDRQNTLLVQATRADRAIIEDLLRVLDTPQLPEAVRANQPRIIPLRNMDASRAEEVVRNVFRVVFTPPQPRYTPWGTQRQPTPGVLTPQLAIDQTTNSLIISGPTAVVEQIAEFVERLDKLAADDPSRQLMIIPLKKLNAPQVERAVRDLLPRSSWRRY